MTAKHAPMTAEALIIVVLFIHIPGPFLLLQSVLGYILQHILVMPCRHFKTNQQKNVKKNAGRYNFSHSPLSIIQELYNKERQKPSFKRTSALCYSV